MQQQKKKLTIGNIADILRKAEDAILVCLLLIMIFMAVAQILLRNLMGTAIIWGDGLVRILVLWIGLAGAMIASRDGSHIKIDLIARFLPEHMKIAVNSIVEISTAIICSLAAWYSIQFVHMEYIDSFTAFAGVPSWMCEIIIPIAFSVIALRYFMLSFMNFRRGIKIWISERDG